MDNYSHQLLIKNRYGEAISKALVSIDDKIVQYSDDLQSYPFNIMNQGFIDISVELSGFEKIHEKYYFTKSDKYFNIYVIKKGEPYVYRQGVRIPYFENRNLLFSDSHNDSLISVIKKLGLEYKSYNKFIDEKKNYDSTHPALNTAIIIFKKNLEKFNSKNCSELKALRNVSPYFNIGPFISTSKSGYPAYTYTNKMKVKLLKPGKKGFNDFSKDLKMAINCDFKTTYNESENICLIEISNLSINESVIKLLDKIKKIDGVEFVDSNLNSYSNLD